MAKRFEKVVISKHAIARYQERFRNIPAFHVSLLLAQCYYKSGHCKPSPGNPSWRSQRVGVDAFGQEVVLCWSRPGKGERVVITTVLQPAMVTNELQNEIAHNERNRARRLKRK